MKINSILFCLFIATLIALSSVQLSKTFSVKTINYPSYWPKPIYDFKKNPLREEVVQLGRRLFYDPILSLDNTISCASCHLSFTAFTHTDHALSHGIHDSIGTRNSPTLINLAWNKHFMWDGAVNHIEVQALAPITHPAEMREDLNHVLEKLNQTPFYDSLFTATFGTKKITSQQLLMSLAQFQLTFVSADSKYDQFIAGKAEFTVQEKNGLKLFQKHCENCHNAPLFTTGEFKNNGLSIDSLLNDKGRGKITQQKSDNYTFKIPTLRNIEFSYPYMHDGRYKTLREVMRHYVEHISPTPNLAKELKNGISLSSNEQVDVIAFLLTLTDKKFLFNSDFQFPRN